MQSRTRSMSMPAAGEGTPSRWSCALKSSEASPAISPPLDPAHETAWVQDPVWIKGLLERAHDRKAGGGPAPAAESLLEGCRGRGHHHLALGAGGPAQARKGLDGGRRRHPNIDQARRRLNDRLRLIGEGIDDRLDAVQRRDRPQQDDVLRGR